MSQSFQARLQAVDRSLLTPLVQQALDHPLAEVLDWTQCPLTGGLAAPAAGILGCIHFAGRADVQDQVVPWALVLKAFAPPREYANSDQTVFTYWKREVLTYQSGLLDALNGGLVAPRCFAVVEYPEEEYWVWMEYIDEVQKRWSLERYQLAARHLGHFNGTYLVGRPLPTYPWLNSGHLQQWLTMGARGLQELPRLAHHPKSWVTPELSQRTLHLSATRAGLLEQLDRLPHCLCHHDAFRRNLLAQRTAQGEEQTVAVDWATIGPGVIGRDVAHLVTMSLLFLELPMVEMEHLDQLAFAAYLAGLHEVGWQGDKAVIRFGYTATAALFIGLGALGVLLPRIEDEQRCVQWEQRLGHSYTQIHSRWRELQQFVLTLGDEAQTLLKQLTA
jgi:hypothetical protein